MQCNTYDKDGSITPKISYDTHADSKKEAIRLRKISNGQVKIVTYQCKICRKFHIGKDLQWIRKKLKR